MPRAFTEQQKQSRREASNRWKAGNKEAISAYNKAYVKAHQLLPGWTQKRNLASMISRSKNPEHYLLYRKHKYATDIQFRLRVRLRASFKERLRSSTTALISRSEMFGCSIGYLIAHIETKFQPGMTWNNYGSWHIDHIVPLRYFDLTNKEQQLKACNYKNLQPLWRKDNLRKGGRF